MSDPNYFSFHCQFCQQRIEAQNEYYQQRIACPSCGQSILAQPETITPPKIPDAFRAHAAFPQRGSETVYMNEFGVYVSNSRFTVHSQTYAMSGITSVKPMETPADRAGSTLMFIFGGFLILFSFVAAISYKSWPTGGTLLLSGVGVFWAGVATYKGEKPTYSVLLTTAGGEMKAVSSKDREFIWKTIQALNQSIICRG